MRFTFYLIEILLMALFLASCSARKSDGGFALNPTIYYKPTIILSEETCSEDDLRDLVSPEGQKWVSLCKEDFAACLMQGSCDVDDGQSVTSYNYHSKKDKTPRFVAVDSRKCPYGYGVKNICLDPYFSVAADLKFYSPGDVIFVPRLVGARLPTGEVHDGYLIVRDAGGGVVGANRFDFFTGRQSHQNKTNIFAELGFADLNNSFEFRRATSEETLQVKERRHYPGLQPFLLK